jgi:signal transduction histidine kinase
LLRIAQEALTNVRRHALATKVVVKLEKTSEAVAMIVKDNGQGFSLSDLEKTPPGYHGLNIIKERAEGLGGSLDISTAPGGGTELRVSLPLDKVRL